MAFFISPFLALWAIFLIWYLKKSWKIIWLMILGGLWGIALAAFFTLPVIFEKKFVHLETMFMGYFNYLAHFATLNQLFFTCFWGYGSSAWGPEDGLSFSLGQVHWLTGVIALLIFIWLYLKQKQKETWLVAFLFILFLTTAFLTHQRSSFFWKIIPVLANMQFPWRFVGLSSFFLALLPGSLLLLIKNQKKSLILTLFLILVVIFANFSFFRPEKIIQITDNEKLFSAKGWHKLQTDAIFDYLPIYAPLPPASPAPDKPYFIRGEGGEIKNFQKGTNWQKFEANVLGESFLQFPLYDFPGWQVLVNGRPTEINHENELGLITIKLKEGNYQIEAKLKNTPIRKISNYCSLTAWLGLLFFVCLSERKKKNVKI